MKCARCDSYACKGPKDPVCIAPELLAAMREVDAMLPESPPITPSWARYQRAPETSSYALMIHGQMMAAQCLQEIDRAGLMNAASIAPAVAYYRQQFDQLRNQVKPPETVR